MTVVASITTASIGERRACIRASSEARMKGYVTTPCRANISERTRAELGKGGVSHVERELGMETFRSGNTSNEGIPILPAG
jgi:hypothetical protein